MTFDELIVFAVIVAIISGAVYYYFQQRQLQRIAQKELNNLISKNIDNYLPRVKECAERFEEIKSMRKIKKESI